MRGQRPNSMLTFEKEPFQGAQNIVEKLTVSGVHVAVVGGRG